MGYSDWSDTAFQALSTPRAQARPEEIFRLERSIDPLMDPRNLRLREARDSVHHPASVPIIVAFDVTASMGDIPTRFAQSLLGALMRRLLEEGWVTDPQLCFAAVGDAVSDRAPLQVGQFESGLEMDQWLTRIWLECRGGDPPESYTLVHWFAAHHTATDALQRRGKKGYLFTIGDATNKPLQTSHIRRVFGYQPTTPVDDATVIAASAQGWELFHVLVTRGRPAVPAIRSHWEGLIGPRVLELPDVEAIVTLMGVTLGRAEGRLPGPVADRILEAAGLPAATRATVAALP